MKYFIRSVKYFVYFSLLCSIMVAALVLIGAVEGDINSIFSEGYGSLWKIAIFFAVVAAVYPKVGFITRDIMTDKDWNEVRNEVIAYMKERNFCIESENKTTITFRYKSATGRLIKMYEDRLTLNKTGDGYQMEGLRKDVLRLAMGLEYHLNPKE